MVQEISIPKILSIDFGTKRIGLAMSIEGTKIVKPFTTIQTHNDVFEDIVKLARMNEVDTIVVGLPRDINGNETEQTRLCKNFGVKLGECFNKPVVFQDEAATSLEAEDLLKQTSSNYQKQTIDNTAAAIIGRDFMETLGGKR